MIPPLKISERERQSMILEYLAHRKDVFAFRHNNMPVFDTKRGIFRRMSKWTPKGIADILGIYRRNGVGVFLAIEVKQPEEKLRPEQADFLSKINSFGGLAFVANDAEQVADILDNVFSQNVVMTSPPTKVMLTP